MLYKPLRLCSIVCCSLVAISFALFAVGQTATASRHQVATLGVSSAAAAPAPAKPEGQPRRFIDQAARVLTSPFSSLVKSSSQWARRIIETLCALLVYGLGLGFLARWLRGVASRPRSYQAPGYQ